jgi:hypothetical protein
VEEHAACGLAGLDPSGASRSQAPGLRCRCHDGEVPPTLCAHGLPADSCLICEQLGAKGATPARAGQATPPGGGGRRSIRTGLVGVAVAGVVAVLVVSWLAALVWTVFRLVETLAVAFLSGWVGWRLGVRHGRHSRPS